MPGFYSNLLSMQRCLVYAVQIIITKHCCIHANSVIFVFVNMSPNIIYRKLTASLLLALFVLIHVEKIFHTHSNRIDNKGQTGFSTVSKNAVCTICSFTLAKDSQLPEPVSIVTPFSFLMKEYISGSASYHFFNDNYYSNRGPPSC